MHLGSTVLDWLNSLLGDPAHRRAWVLAANDGVIATAGILEGFAGAGVDDATIFLAAMAATVSGSLAAGGAKWAEEASERDAQLLAIEEERREIRRQPEIEHAELAAYYEGKGLSPHLAAEVATELMRRSPLKAQLESEHGVLELISPADIRLSTIGTTLAYAAGAAVPLLVTILAPVQLETPLVLVAVVLSLSVTAIIGARAGRVNVARTLVRTLVIGVGTMAISYLVGLLAF